MWLIAKKDFLDNLFSAKFLVGFVLCLILIPFSILLNIDDYGDRVRLYQMDRDEADKDFKEVRVYSKLRPEIVKPPESLSIFAKGNSDQLGYRVKIFLGEKPLIASGNARTQDNPLLDAFATTDFTGIITIVMSLLALMFSYDLCTKEKEDGTLRLQLSNSVSRGTLLAGKLLGIMLTLLPVLLFCFLMGSLLILLSPQIHLNGLEWMRVSLLFLASFVLVIFYSVIGLLISAKRQSSVQSLVIALLFWVVTVFIVPNGAAYIASSFIKTESRDNLDAVIKTLEKERSDKIREFKSTLAEPDWRMSRSGRNGRDAGRENYGCSKSYFEWHRLLASFEAPLFIEYADIKWPHHRRWWESLQKQRQVADVLSWLSPAGIFRTVANTICYVDAASHERFLETTRRYRETLIRYFTDKKIFSDFRYVTPTKPEDMMTADQLVYYWTGREFRTLRELRDWTATQPDRMILFTKIKQGKTPGMIPDDFAYLNLDDVPRFQWERRHLMTGIRNIAVQIAALIFLIIVLFYVSFLAFIRYDVR